MNPREPRRAHLHVLTYGDLQVLTAMAWGNNKGIARTKLDNMYGFRPCKSGKGQKKKVGTAKPK